MLRSVSVLVFAGVLVLGCVSIAPTTTTRPTGPSPVVVTLPPLPAPTVAATAAPTVAISAPPSVAPATLSPAPTEPPPTAQASPAGVENYGASTPLINDTFDDPDSGWGVGTNGGGSVFYGTNSLDVATAATGSWERSTRMTGATSNAVHLEAVYTPSGTGYVGLLCAERDDELWGVAANGDGQYSFIKVGTEGATILSQGQMDELGTPDVGIASLALDCAGTATGSFKMQVSPGGTNVGAQYFAPVDEGPHSFDRAGIYAESITDPYSVSVDYILVFGGDGDTSMSPEAKELMTHIPVDWQPKCFEAFASVFATGVSADILCQLDGGRSDWAEYTSFDSQADMDGYFQYLVDKWAVPEQDVNCDSGPHLGGYSIGGQHAGQVLCAPSVTGTQFVWTTDHMLILGQLIDLEGSYADMYLDWLDAGPN